MMGLVMAGGRGSRMAMGTEKLLLRYYKPVIVRVLDSLYDSGCVEDVLAVTSPNAPRTADLLSRMGVHTVHSRGEGYSQDLGLALHDLSGMVLVVPGDLPLLDGKMVRILFSGYDPSYDWTTFLVEKHFSDSLGVSAGPSVIHDGRTCLYTGVSIVNATGIRDLVMVREHCEIINDRRIAFNLNTRREYDLLRAAYDPSI